MRSSCANGTTHSLFILSDNSVWSCGSNANGELGLGNFNDCLNPQKINNCNLPPNLPPILSVSAGFNFTLLLDEKNCVWGCGRNDYGQLGKGGSFIGFLTSKLLGDINIPTKIEGLPPIIAISCGYLHSLFLDNKGSVWSCGANEYGELGLGDTKNRSKPEKIGGLPKIKSIWSGSHHSLFLDNEGAVWSCGYNIYGQLGLRHKTNIVKAEKIEGIPRINSISGNAHFSMFIDITGNVWSCGLNENGELGLRHNTLTIATPKKIRTLPEIISTGGGIFCSMFLDRNGALFTCGNNNCGQLGLGNKYSTNTPHRVEGLPPIVALSSSSHTSSFLVVDIEGGVWGCGSNVNGQLGVGHKQERLKFERIENLGTLKIEYQMPVPIPVLLQNEKQEHQICKSMLELEMNKNEKLDISLVIASDENKKHKMMLQNEKDRTENLQGAFQNIQKENQKLQIMWINKNEDYQKLDQENQELQIMLTKEKDENQKLEEELKKAKVNAEKWELNELKKKKKRFLRKSQEKGWSVRQSSQEDLEFLFEEFGIIQFLNKLNCAGCSSFDDFTRLDVQLAMDILQIQVVEAIKLIFNIKVMANGIFTKEENEKHLKNCPICKIGVKKGLEEYGIALQIIEEIAKKMEGMNLGEVMILELKDYCQLGIGTSCYLPLAQALKRMKTIDSLE